VAALAVGCGDKDTDTETSGGTDSGATTDMFSQLINVEEAPSGDFVGFEAGYEGDWLVQEVDPKKQVTVAMSGMVLDFETDDMVEDPTVEIFYGNAISGTADQTVEGDSDGNVSGEWPLCQPIAYRTTTDPALGDTKVTIQFSEVAGFAKDTNIEFDSVSSATYQVIPSLLGVSPDPAKGVIAGTAYDIAGEAFSGAQVLVRGADGTIPSGIVSKYFRDEFPNRDQEWTSDDGLWVIINVPVGDWEVEMYTADGSGGHILMGTTSVAVVADSINISSAYAGYGDGVVYPESCLADAEK
jgi:hypothetical protein